MKNLLPSFCLCLMASIWALHATPTQVSNPRLEYLKNPLGIDVQKPRFSWELSGDEQNKAQSAYRILVATDSTALDAGKNLVWDSRKTKSRATNQIFYAGKTLAPNTLYYWTVEVWDEKGKSLGRSEIARFLTAPAATPSEWKAVWIGEKSRTIPYEEQYYQPFGYRSAQETTDNVKKSILIDFGTEKTFDAVKIYPMRWREKIFPVRFNAAILDASTKQRSQVVIDETANDVKLKSDEFYLKKLEKPVTARYFEINILKLAPAITKETKENEEKKFEYGLAEIEFLHNSESVGIGADVVVTDTTAIDWKWEAQWLTDGFTRPSNRKNYFDVIPPSPMIRKEISFKKKIKSAFWSTSAQGVYEAFINGQKVGNGKLSPEFTDYDSHIQYQTVEVTDLLRQGSNAFAAMLADGWFAGARWSYPNRGGYGLFRKFIGQLLVNYDDGSQEIFGTDGSWKICTQGPVREASNLGGEVYDASYEQKGWNDAGFDDSAWQPVSVYRDEKWNLVAQMNEPVAVIKELKAVSVHKVGKNKYIFDIGQNMPGWVRLDLNYNPKNAIRFRYGEYLYDDGTLYTDNLREAKQIDLYIPSENAGKITYEPRFTYHGFRYVEVEGLTKEPHAEDITGIVVASSSPVASEFSCSDKTVNQLWSNIRWTLWGNLISIPTDCPQRDEREGWMADAQIFSQTAAYNLDMAAFYTKWERDIRDSQLPDGRYPDIAPHDGTWRNFFGAPGWADAGVIIPWRVYENYNDRVILAESFESMRRWVDFVHKHNQNLLWQKYRFNDYNDWLNGNWINSLDDYPKDKGSVPNEVFGTAYFAYCSEIVAKTAKLLGKTVEYNYYSRLAADIRKAFNKEYVDADAKIKGDTQTGYAMALQFDLLPENIRQKAADNMAEAVKYYDYRISTGIHGTVMLMNQLCEYGYSDIAWRLLLSRRFPSWFYSIDQGATTIWERWDGYVAGRGFQDAGMNSFNHVAIGAVGEWLYRHILGIQLDAASPAFRHFFVKPCPGKDLTWAKGNYHSINGNIEVSWTNEGGKFSLELTVPANTSATVVLPDGTKREVGAGRQTFIARIADFD